MTIRSESLKKSISGTTGLIAGLSLGYISSCPEGPAGRMGRSGRIFQADPMDIMLSVKVNSNYNLKERRII
jgi:hypothetical protein